MAALYLTESDVEQTLSMRPLIDEVAVVFRKHGMTEVANIPRGRARTDHGLLHIMGAAAKTLGVMACKVYTSTKTGTRFLVHLYDGRSGALLALMEADFLGAMRTGAVSGLATQLMARRDADTVGILGSGKQARTQLEAVAQVRNLVEAYVYSPNADHRERFAYEMSAQLGLKVVAVNLPELAVEDKDIVITATDSREPVLREAWLSPGCHVNAVGSNFIGKAELDVETVRRCATIVVDDKEQARLEAGELVQAVEAGILRWSEVGDLSNVVIGRYPARHAPDDITLFKSVGVAYADLAAAKLAYERAVAAGIGQTLPF